MNRRLGKLLILVLVGLFVLSVSGLAGCGGGEASATNKVKVGWLWDFTGRASLGVTEMYTGLRDYLRMTAEEDPVPGVEIQMLTYDTKSDTSRVPVGYLWLKGQGTEIFSAAPHDTQLLKPKFEADNLPVYNTSSQLPLITEPWLVNLYGTPESQYEILMRWISETWDGAGKPKIAIVGLAGVPFYDEQRKMVERIVSENPAEFEYLGAQMAPTTTTAWASEISRIKGSDYVICLSSGPPLASFISEAAIRGYDGVRVGAMESFISFWSIVKGAVSEANLDGIVCGTYFEWWSDEGAYIDEVKSYLSKYRSSSEVQRFTLSSGYITGWTYGKVLIEVLRKVAGDMGPENVRGANLFTALQEMSLDVPGWDYTWEITSDANALLRGVKILGYSSAKGEWEVVADYAIPPTLG